MGSKLSSLGDFVSAEDAERVAGDDWSDGFAAVFDAFVEKEDLPGEHAGKVRLRVFTDAANAFAIPSTREPLPSQRGVSFCDAGEPSGESNGASPEASAQPTACLRRPTEPCPPRTRHH